MENAKNVASPFLKNHVDILFVVINVLVDFMQNKKGLILENGVNVVIVGKILIALTKYTVLLIANIDIMINKDGIRYVFQELLLEACLPKNGSF